MKIDDYDLKGIPKEVEDFFDSVKTIFNYGKYSHSLVVLAPTWQAKDGETVLFKSGSAERLYFFLNSGWTAIEINSQLIRSWISFSGTGTVSILDSNNVTSVTRNSLGDFTLTWDVDFANVSYAGAMMVKDSGNREAVIGITDTANNPALGSMQVWVRRAGAVIDPSYASILTTGAQ